MPSDNLFNLKLHLVNVVGLTVFIGILTLPVLISANLLTFSQQTGSSILGINIEQRDYSIKIEPAVNQLTLDKEITLSYPTDSRNLILYDNFLEIYNSYDKPITLAIVTRYSAPNLFFGHKNQISGRQLATIRPKKILGLNLVAKPTGENSPKVKKLQFILTSL